MSLLTTASTALLLPAFGRAVARRGLALSASSQAAAQDPIQELFVTKVREYATKKKQAGGKLVDADAKVEEGLKKELEKVQRQFGLVGEDATKFPTMKFPDFQVEKVEIQ